MSVFGAVDWKKWYERVRRKVGERGRGRGGGESTRI